MAQVLEELRGWQAKLGEPLKDTADNDPRQIVATTLPCLEKNEKWMNYPE